MNPVIKQVEIIVHVTFRGHVSYSSLNFSTTNRIQRSVVDHWLKYFNIRLSVPHMGAKVSNMIILTISRPLKKISTRAIIESFFGPFVSLGILWKLIFNNNVDQAVKFHVKKSVLF